ncbi:hypothetical protein PIIN_10505 [Serendipita indica DSM 11827]|uniref:SET domain-containing protein n=1 Tax=Serendipita indica (strain DSM 11827) TaxID=1109443 RepID=G4TYW9_SERID|nr:hypothetical protein PIIN_10505 [Serendipita indica DSM 11827]
MNLPQSDFFNVVYRHPNLLFHHDHIRAATDIEAGEMVLIEVPVLKLRATVSSNSSLVIDAQEFAAAWNLLSPDKQAAFRRLQLNNNFTSGVSNQEIDRWYSNCLAYLQGQLYAVPIVGCRFQQSCRPNIRSELVKIGQNNSWFEFRTLCRITQGTLLRMSYDVDGILHPAQSRQNRLLARKGVSCECESCSFPTRSDPKRGRAMGVLETEHPAISEIGAALQALHDEGVYHFDGSLYYDAYLEYHSNGDRSNGLLCYKHCLRIAERDGVPPPAELQ